ncbi:MFS transporter [Streptomyces acidiscabies]|uniref:MFS transporter n=3 Tax=Streptomyces acidiscabies TaxID=42234 RepID=A0AAP6BGJ0_9ACTN|nr:MFS transporter [Streptomyces acidiscabies]MBZ3914483.1 MFS transporter [Streptomyces acidiscabies]MDX2964350.1 MFS transporter [Streptomyces acidiscabies]MDX3017171.1 MFS transporter [Streptomyces acidiscabies]MDX3789122.1 MFS transporter [Streptomyces acidiscabies]GAV38603.1 antiseptic resistance protein [Streptomyces acidiscabies]
MSAPALKRSTLLALCACVLVAQSMVAAINLLIPQLAASDLRPSHAEILWTVDAYVIAFAGLLIPAGALGDRYGRKGALLAGLALFAIGAGVSASATTPALLIAGRGVSGAGAALITPATMSLVVHLAGPARRAQAMASWTLAIGLGGMVGNLGGGLVGQFLTWRALFGAMVPLAGVLAIVVAVTTPRTDRSPRNSLDPVGTLLLTAGLVAVLFGIIESPEHGWTSGVILAAFGVGAGLIGGFAGRSVRAARRVDSAVPETGLGAQPSYRAPLFDPRLFRSPQLRATVLGLATGFFGLFALFFVNSQYLQEVKGYGPGVTGVAILPVIVGMALVPKFAARWSAHPRPVVGAGLALIGLGLLGTSTADAGTPYLLYACWLLTISVGTGLAMPALTLGVATSLPPHQTGLGSGLGTSAREIGAALGVAVSGTLLAHHTDLASGMGSALRIVGITVLVSTALVITEFRAPCKPKPTEEKEPASTPANAT